jgi:site-specific DNA-adenine methylase
MFSYYGSKRQLAGFYAEPRHDLIVEPFAGSAGYSLHGNRWRNDVLLLDRDARLVGVWEWLIGEATRAVILALPELRVGETSSEFLSIASVATRTVNSRSTAVVTPSMVVAWEESRSFLAADIEKIKHWRVRCGEYDDAPDIAATWFVDPPYEGRVGDGYVHGSPGLDYARLASWIRSRTGQTIACESGVAEYLPFEPLRAGTDNPDDEHAEFIWSHDTKR